VATAEQLLVVATGQLEAQVPVFVLPGGTCQLGGGNVPSLNCSFRKVDGVSAAAGRAVAATVVSMAAATATASKRRRANGRWVMPTAGVAEKARTPLYRARRNRS
jgi:hypothetical protein